MSDLIPGAGPTAPAIPQRSTSLAAPISTTPQTGTGYNPDNTEPYSRAAKKKLKRSASSLNKYADPDDWWNANDELIRIDLDEAQQQFYEAKRLFLGGKVPQEEWDVIVIHHLRGISALREAHGNLRKEYTELRNALNQNYDLSPQPSRNFVSLLIEFLEGQESRSSKKQTEFRKQLLNVHQGWDSDQTGIFCPVLGQYMSSDDVTASHIYPYLLGTTVMRMLFGEDSVGELFHARNGLLLTSSVERKFDRHQVVIVPADGARLQNDGTIDRWVLKIVDDSIKNQRISGLGGNGRMSDLHGRELVWKTSARPAARYLYFHYLIATLRVKKHGRKPFRPTREPAEPLDPLKRPVSWATPGPYLRESMVRALMAESGHQVFQDRELDGAIPEKIPPGLEEKALAAALITGREGLGEGLAKEDDEEDMNMYSP